MELTERDKELIRTTIQETVLELKKAGLLKSVSDQAYREASEMLRKYYREGEDDPGIKLEIEKLKDDKYIKVIPLYYAMGYTIEEIAEDYGVEVSTISRNKKRLSLRIYENSKSW